MLLILVPQLHEPAATATDDTKNKFIHNLSFAGVAVCSKRDLMFVATHD